MRRRISQTLLVAAVLAISLVPNAWAPLYGHTLEYCEDATFSTVVGTVNVGSPACPDRGGSDGTTSDYRIWYNYSSCYQQAPFTYDTFHCQQKVDGLWTEVSCYQ